MGKRSVTSFMKTRTGGVDHETAGVVYDTELDLNRTDLLILGDLCVSRQPS